jgi:hypothetical protein
MPKDEGAMGRIKLEQLRFYAKNPAETAKFYEALGYDMVHISTRPEVPDNFPVFHGGPSGEPEIAIFQLDTAPNAKTEEAALGFLVEDVRTVEERLQGLGTMTGSEARMVHGPTSRIYSDPDGRLVLLDSFFLYRLGKPLAEWKPMRPTHYHVGDRAVYDGVNYACIVDHDADEDKAPPKLPAFWRAI